MGAEQSTNGISHIIVDLSPVSHIDTSAIHILEDICDNYKVRNITLCLSNPSRIVMSRMVGCGLVDKIGEENIFVSTHVATCTVLQRIAVKDDIEIQQTVHDASSDSTENLCEMASSEPTSNQANDNDDQVGLIITNFNSEDEQKPEKST